MHNFLSPKISSSQRPSRSTETRRRRAASTLRACAQTASSSSRTAAEDTDPRSPPPDTPATTTTTATMGRTPRATPREAGPMGAVCSTAWIATGSFLRSSGSRLSSSWVSKGQSYVLRSPLREFIYFGRPSMWH